MKKIFMVLFICLLTIYTPEICISDSSIGTSSLVEKTAAERGEFTTLAQVNTAKTTARPAVYASVQKRADVQVELETATQTFVIRKDGTVVDKMAGRMWLKDANYPMRGMTWEEAMKYCENLNYAGHSDWRVPSRRELEALIGTNKGIDKAYPEGHPFRNIVAHGSYWSSSPNPPGHTYTYSVNVVSGSVDSLNKDRVGYVWPVRYVTEKDLSE